MPHCLSIFLEVFDCLPTAAHCFSERLGKKAVGMSGVLGGARWAQFEISARSPVKSREFRLHCERGVAWLDEGWTNHIKIGSESDGTGGDMASVQQRVVSRELPLFRELRTFVEHLRGGPPPRSSAADGALIVARIQELRAMAGL